eukprot:GEMP01007060.1.p1 GENE.GEMP01007060.1~~GEMP01007060.1.p1  ORF type:complete len:604 (+),score=116.03 GEMP01007060.1:114-1925(+)
MAPVVKHNRSNLPNLPGLSLNSTYPPCARLRRHFGTSRLILLPEDVPNYSDEAMLQLISARENRYAKTGPPITHEERREIRANQRKIVPMNDLPAWLKHDRQVLCFTAYFQETVYLDAHENSRLRQCTLMYFMEDGTLKVREPKLANSGLPHGVLVKRHRVPHPDGGFFEPRHFKLGTSVVIYCRAFQLVDCDSFTRWYFTTSKIDLGTANKMPEDAFVRKKRDEELQKLENIPLAVIKSKEYTELCYGASRKNAKLKQYMENDRKVLRFYASWDDPTFYGARNFFIVHYFLADDTLEVRQQQELNQYSVPCPVFSSRKLVPKARSEMMATPGMDESVLNWITPKDLILGTALPVCGRELFLYDCDDFTKDFYKKWLDVNQISIPGYNDELKPQKWRNQEEVPECPKRDVLDDLWEEHLESGDQAMRFEATNTHRQDADRRFIVMFYLTNSTMAVFEKRQRNSGHVEGKFADRRKMINPDTKKAYSAADFYMGATITVYSVKFNLGRADEHTLSFMERYSDAFPFSDPLLIVQKIKNLRDDEELAALQSISPVALRDLIKRKLSGLIVEQELVTLLRTFPFADQGPKAGEISVHSLLENMLAA